MSKEQFLKKIVSRKLWVAIAGFVSGVIMAVNADENLAQTVSALILQGASVIGYIFAEGLTDVASLKNESASGNTVSESKE